MDSVSKNLKTPVLKETILSVLKWSSPTTIAVLISYLETVTDWEVSFLGPTILARSSLVLLISLLVLSAYSMLQWKNKKNKYEFDKFLGLWKERKADFHICSSCKSKNIISPMMETETQFICPIKGCRHTVYKEGRAPQKQVQTSRWREDWMSRTNRH